MTVSAWQYYVFEKATLQVQIPPEILKFQGNTISAQAPAVCQEVPMPSMPQRIKEERGRKGSCETFEKCSSRVCLPSQILRFTCKTLKLLKL